MGLSIDQNYCDNPYFDEDTSGWATNDSPNFARVINEDAFGKYMIELTESTSPTVYANYAHTDDNPINNRIWMVTVRIKADSNIEAGVQIHGTSSILWQAVSLTTNIKRITLIATASGQSGNDVSIRVYAKNGAGSSNVYFDGEKMQQGTLEEVLEAQGIQARYVGAFGEGGAQFLVYIPHFSEHIIEIESLVPLVEEVLFTETNYVVIGLSVLALIGLSGHVYKIGKSRT